MNERVRKSVAHAEPLIDPVAGLPCLALFPENGEWYRAQVLQVLPAGIRVQFVDYGNLMTIPNCHASYRRMKQSLSDCPIYAAKVKLAGVTPVNEGGCWDAETNAKFISHVLNREYWMECVCLDAVVDHQGISQIGNRTFVILSIASAQTDRDSQRLMQCIIPS